VNPLRKSPWAVRQLRPYLLILAVVGVLQSYYLLLPALSAAADWVAYFVVPLSLLGLLALWFRWENRPASDFGLVVYERPRRTLALVTVLVLADLLILVEAGLFVGIISVPFPSLPAATGLLLAAPLIAVSQVAIFQGYFLRTQSDDGRLMRALGLSAGAFALATTNFPLLLRLPPMQAGDYLFSTTAAAFAFAIVLGVFAYKSRWSLFGPACLATVLLVLSELLPWTLASSNWELAFFIALFADCAMLLLLLLLVREPGYLAARYLGEQFGAERFRFLRRSRGRRSLRNTIFALGVVTAVSLSAVVALQAYTGERTPILAIATGSMAPALEPGNLVMIQHVGPNVISPGTIIAFTGSCLPSPTVHRVVEVSTGATGVVYLTKGDANPTPDPCWVPYSEVLGRVISTVPGLGYFILQPALLGGVAVLALLIPAYFRREESGYRKSRSGMTPFPSGRH